MIIEVFLRQKKNYVCFSEAIITWKTSLFCSPPPPLFFFPAQQNSPANCAILGTTFFMQGQVKFLQARERSYLLFVFPPTQFWGATCIITSLRPVWFMILEVRSFFPRSKKERRGGGLPEQIPDKNTWKGVLQTLTETHNYFRLIL